MLCRIIGLLPLTFLSFTLTAGSPQIEKLVPPQLSQENIREEIVCTRPMREGKFNISLECRNGKTIVNCYGHGGSGWTTLFGSINQAINVFKSISPNTDLPIRVIGSGCMGLTAAIELARAGYKVKGITTKELYEIPSWKAAGYFALVSLKTSPEEEENLKEIGLNTFLTYRTIEQGNHPYITKNALRYMPVYCSSDTESGVEDLERQGLIPPREEVSLDFGNGVTHHNFVKYMTYFMNTTTIMRQLTSEIKRLQIPIEQREIKGFSEVEEEIVFNCSGLGSQQLTSDDKMIPVRGHLITLHPKAGTEHMDYMIYTKVEQEGLVEYVYMFPKNLSVTPANKEGIPCSGVLGGSFIPFAANLTPEEQEKLDRIEFERLLDRNSWFFLGHSFSKKEAEYHNDQR